MASDKIVHLNKSNFEAEVIRSDIPVVVDFWAEWCGPCKAIAPVLEELAEELAGKVKIAKLDVDENQSLAAQFGIRGIPTLLIFSGGKIVEQIIGFRQKQALLDTISKHVG